MSNDLYFIPIIAKALEQEDTEQSLEKAFKKIESLGTEPRYERGFEQFQQFMDVVNAQVKKRRLDDLSKEDLIVGLIADLATDIFDGSDEEKQRVLSIIESQPQWKKEYDRLVAETAELTKRPRGIQISVLRENELLESITFPEIPASKTIEHIIPGAYTIASATGRLIWEGELSGQELIWAKAYPGKPVRLAADSAKREEKPTKEICVSDGEIIIRVFSGIENGSMEVTMTALGDSQ